MDEGVLILWVRGWMEWLYHPGDWEGTHNCLDHLHTLLSHLVDDTRHINQVLFLHLLQDDVNGYECPCATHTSTGGNGELITA